MKVKRVIVYLFVILYIYCAQSLAASEPEITFSVKALFKDRAMIEINGENRFMSAGQLSPEGIELVSSNAHEAKIICHGEEHTLYINQTVYSGGAKGSSKSEPKVYKKLVPGKIVPFTKTNVNSMTKYMLKDKFDYPSVIRYGQHAVWIGSGKKLLRFDLKKEAWGVFDSSYYLDQRISDFAISEKNIILSGTKRKNNKNLYGLFSFDTKARKFHHVLDTNPRSYQFVGEELWFLSSDKGLGYITLKKTKLTTKSKDALLDKDKKNIKGYALSATGHDIWYSNSSKYGAHKEKQRLNEVCVTHYNNKNKTYATYTRKDMGIESNLNCRNLAASESQVWVSHGSKHSGLSVLDISTGKWAYITASSNNVLVGGEKIILDDDQLWMLVSNQFVRLNTRTLQANVVLGDAIIKNPWHSSFYVKDGHAWFSTVEYMNQRRSKSKLVLYKIPVNSFL